MDAPRLTPNANQKLGTGSTRTDFGVFFAHKDRLARLSMAVAILALVTTALALSFSAAHLRQGLRFIVLDPAGNWTLAPGNTFAEATELHVQQALLAANALLLRNPENFDQPEVIEAMFGSHAIAQAIQLKRIEAAEFHDRRLQQKPQVARIDAIDSRDDRAQVEVVGQLLRTGLPQKAPFTEVIPFKLRLTFQPNPDLLRSRRQPTVVTQFHLSYEKPSTSQVGGASR